MRKMTRSSRPKKVEPRTHIVKPNGDETPEYTYCARNLKALHGRCTVNSVEAATCEGCIKEEQRLRGLKNRPMLPEPNYRDMYDE